MAGKDVRQIQFEKDQEEKRKLQQSKGFGTPVNVNQKQALGDQAARAKEKEILTKQELANKFVLACAQGRMNIQAQDTSQGDLYSVQGLVNEGADINMPDKFGKLAINEAIRNDRTEVIDYLLEKHVLLKFLSDDQPLEIPLIIAIQKKSKDKVIKLLGNGASVEDVGRIGSPVLHSASSSGDDEIFSIILGLEPKVNRQDSYKSTALHYAAAKGFIKIVKLLAGYKGIRFDLFNEEGYLPIHSAAVMDNWDIVNYFITEDPSMDVNTLSKNKQTPLILAAIYGNKKTVAGLIEAGANIEAKDDQGKTALDYAREKNLAEVVKFLNNYQEKIKVETESKIIAEKDDESENSSASKAEIEFFSKYIMKHILMGGKIDGINEQGTTPLHILAASGYISSIKQIYALNDSLKIDFNTLDKDGNNLLHASIFHDLYLFHYGIISAKEYNEKAISGENVQNTFEYLLEHNVLLATPNNDGFTPFHIAMFLGNEPALASMHSKDNNLVNVKSKGGFSLVHYAVFQGNLAILKKLVSSYNASLGEKDDNLYTPMDYANILQKNATAQKKRDYKEIIKFFIDQDIELSGVSSSAEIDLSNYSHTMWWGGDKSSEIDPQEVVSGKINMNEIDKLLEM